MPRSSLAHSSMISLLVAFGTCRLLFESGGNDTVQRYSARYSAQCDSVASKVVGAIVEPPTRRAANKERQWRFYTLLWGEGGCSVAVLHSANQERLRRFYTLHAFHRGSTSAILSSRLRNRSRWFLFDSTFSSVRAARRVPRVGHGGLRNLAQNRGNSLCSWLPGWRR